MPTTEESDLFTEHEGVDSDDAKPKSTLRRGFGLLWKVLVGLVVLASFGVWVYAYSGAAVRDAPDRFDDIELSRASESICQAAAAEIDELPNALDARNEIERAEQLGESTVILGLMVSDIGRLETSTERDATIMGLWLDDWRVLLADREEYTNRLAGDPDAKFYVTNTGVGERLDRRITRLANTNSMPTCAAPQDVG